MTVICESVLVRTVSQSTLWFIASLQWLLYQTLTTCQRLTTKMKTHRIMLCLILNGVRESITQTTEHYLNVKANGVLIILLSLFLFSSCTKEKSSQNFLLSTRLSVRLEYLKKESDGAVWANKRNLVASCGNISSLSRVQRDFVTLSSLSIV